jgi:hypothetical protein
MNHDIAKKKYRKINYDEMKNEILSFINIE